MRGMYEDEVSVGRRDGVDKFGELTTWEVR